jgi:hypothetical protein
LRTIELLQWLVPVCAGLLALALVMLVLRSEYRAKPPILVRTPAGRLLPLGAAGAPNSLWQAKITCPSNAHHVEYGTLVISDAQLSFIPERAAKPAWLYPAGQLHLTQRSPARLNRGDIDLRLPDGRQLDLTVSKRPINRHLGKLFDGVAQSDHAHVFVSILAANGATCRRQ